MRFTRGEAKSIPAATMRQYTGGQIVHTRSIDEKSRVTAPTSQTTVARIRQRSSAVPKGVPLSGCAMRLMSNMRYLRSRSAS